MSGAVPAKICVVCRQDVSTLKRVKDSAGRYYCQPCYNARAGQRPAAAPSGKTSAAPAAVVPNHPPAIELSDGSDDLLLSASPANAAAAAGNLLGCSGCKKLFSELEMRNVDGEFVCRACTAKRGKVLVYANPDSAGAPRGALLRALGSTAATIVIAISGAFILTFVALMIAEPKGGAAPLGIVVTLVVAGLYTVIFVMQTAVLMLSMLLASHIIGGIEFGALGSAVAKSLAMILFTNFVSMFVPFGGLIVLSFPVLIFFAGMMILFKTDALEAILIGFINMFASIVFGMLMVVGLRLVVGMMR